MASPFSIFRKHQKVWLAVLGVAVMIGFVVFPAILQIQQYYTGSARGNNEVVLKWSHGELTDRDIAVMRNTRSLLLRFQQRVQQAALQKDPSTTFDDVVGIPQTTSAASVVQTMVLARKARDMGLVVSDRAVQDFLGRLSDGVLTPGELAAAKVQAVGRKMTDDQLFAALREELLAQRLRQMAFAGVAVTTPSSAWEYYNRLNRRVTAEFIEFPTAEYLAKVTAEPTDAQIQELYDEAKGRYASPDDPEPGFKRREKINSQYFVADYDTLLQEEKAKITDEQIAQYYEENKENFRIEPEEDDAGMVDEIDPDDPRQAIPTPPVPPTDDEAQSDDSPADADEAPSETETQDGAPGDAGEPGEAGEEAPAVDSEGDTATEEGETPAEEPAPGASDAADVEDSGDAPDGDARASDGETPSATDDDLALPEDAAPKYRPLSEVEDQIRRELAAEPATRRLNEAINDARQRLVQYRDARLAFQLGEEISGVSDPGAFDVEQVASDLGLQSGETGMIDAMSLYEAGEKKFHGLGQSYRLEEDVRNSFRPQRVPFAALGFEEGLQLYQPIESQIGIAVREKAYVAWKVEEKEAYVPELDEIRDEVVKAWKTDKARELARQDAEELAAEASGDESLQAQFGGSRQVLTPGPVSYFDPISVLMFRFQGQQPQLASIEGVEDASSDAVKKEVIKMDVGQVTVVANQPKTSYFVVRLASDETPDVAAREQFMQMIVDFQQGEGPPPELRYVGRTDQLSLFQDWYKQVEEEFDVNWVDQEYLERIGRET